jgi:hypothetical protein
MAKQLQTTELDFDRIKDNIKSFFRRQDSPFKDLDFEGSGLNQILDILAYNTHYNAVNAHMAVNESFLDTAQIRSNVVSHAKLIGYTPQSRIASTAEISLEFDAGEIGSLSVPKGSSFIGKVDSVTFTFKTKSETPTQEPVDGKFKFENIEIIEGVEKTDRFVYNNLANQRFTIADQNIDKTTLVIRVKENATISDDNATTYKLFSVGDAITDTSEIYYIFENYDGRYQIEFGNDVFGKKPTAGSVIICEYLSTKGPEANGIHTFSLASWGDPSFPIATTKIGITSKSAGGVERDSIENIKFNAPLSFTAKNRAVTSNDYKAIINERFSNLIQDISVFGGQEKTPPQYGKVFIAIKPKSGEEILTPLQKETIKSYLDDKKMLAIDTEIIDADLTFLYLKLFVTFDANKTSLLKPDLEKQIRNNISVFDASFQEFENVFRYSKFLKQVDETNSSILNSLAQVYCYKKFSIQSNATIATNIDFGFKLFGEIDQPESFINTTSWRINNVNYQIDDIPINGSATTRKLRLFRLSSTGEKIISEYNAGTLVPETGKLIINALPTDSTVTIEVRVRPDSYDILSKREQLIAIDLDKTTINITDKNEAIQASIID